MTTTAQMDASVKQRLEALRKRIDEARQEKARAEAALEHAQRQREEALAKLGELGVTEDQLEAELERLAEDIRAGLEEAERLLSTPLDASRSAGGVDPF